MQIMHHLTFGLEMKHLLPLKYIDAAVDADFIAYRYFHVFSPQQYKK